MSEVWLYCEIDQACRRPSFLDFVERWGPTLIAKRLPDSAAGQKVYSVKVTKGTAEAVIADYARHEPSWYFCPQLRLLVSGGDASKRANQMNHTFIVCDRCR